MLFLLPQTSLIIALPNIQISTPLLPWNQNLATQSWLPELLKHIACRLSPSLQSNISILDLLNGLKFRIIGQYLFIMRIWYLFIIWCPRSLLLYPESLIEPEQLIIYPNLRLIRFIMGITCKTMSIQIIREKTLIKFRSKIQLERKKNTINWVYNLKELWKLSIGLTGHLKTGQNKQRSSWADCYSNQNKDGFQMILNDNNICPTVWFLVSLFIQESLRLNLCCISLIVFLDYVPIADMNTWWSTWCRGIRTSAANRHPYSIPRTSYVV
jgi:hypothetical protein